MLVGAGGWAAGQVLIGTEGNIADGVLIAGSVLTRSVWGTLVVPVGNCSNRERNLTAATGRGF